MVTAGVYLLARLNGLYLHAPEAMAVVAWIGAATALLGATMGVTQFNLKKVLAYSTISQIGFMVMACGVGAFSVGLFHLMTHAFFKACLFLGAGAVLHALQGEEDMRNMGALARRLPFTFATFLAATLALCGIPPFAGFFSKDEILWQAWSGRAARPGCGSSVSRLRAHRFLHVPRDLPHVLRHESRPGTALGRRARATAFDVDRPRRARRRLARRRLHRNARRPARAPRRLGAVLRLSRAAVPRGPAGASRCEHRDRADGDRASRGGRGHLPGVALLRTCRRERNLRKRRGRSSGSSAAATSSTRSTKVCSSVSPTGCPSPCWGADSRPPSPRSRWDCLPTPARHASRLLARLQTGNVQAYVFYVLVGLAVALGWGVSHG
jgi:hypothetical protein